MKVVIILDGITETNVGAVHKAVVDFSGSLRGTFPGLIPVFDVADVAEADTLLAALHAIIGPLGLAISRVFNDRDLTILSTRDHEYTPPSTGRKLGI